MVPYRTNLVPWYGNTGTMVPGTLLVEQKTTCIYTARTTISTKAKILRVHSI